MVDVVLIAQIFGALTVLIGGIITVYKFYDNSKRQDKRHAREIRRIKEENTLLCFGLAACLDGLEQLGANHSVPEAKNMLNKHLNKAAHNDEEE